MKRTQNSSRKKLKKSTFMMDLAQKHRLKSVGIFEKVSKTTCTGKKKWKKAKRFIQQVLDEFSEYKDPDYPPEDQNLTSLLEQNSKLAKFMAWYRIDSFLKDKYLIFHDIKIRHQVMRNRGYTYLIDALNVLSLQPGAVIRLFEKKKICNTGIYSVWLNIDGVWTQNIIDDFIPIYDDHFGKTKIFFSTPNPVFKEIWYCLLEKAMAKAYGGYKKLFHGFENYAMRDLTGAPHSIYDVPYVCPERGISQREVDYMNEAWEKLYKLIKKGYLLSAVPRVPTQSENLQKKNLKIPNKKYYLSKGIYSGHSYGIVTIEEVIVSMGQVDRLIKLRNPWIDEVWQGEWSQKSSNWTPELRNKLGYFESNEENGEFWMNIKDFMNYFECLNIYKLIPGFCYNAIKVPLKPKRFMRTVVRISVPSKGKYTFSVNQKDLRFYEDQNLRYSPVKLTLGMIQKNEFKLLSHTSSTKLRNTDIRKLIDKGEYYLLIEKHAVDENSKLINNNPEIYKKFNEITVSTYGPKTCKLKALVDREGSDTMFDYLTYYGWKGYSQQRIGKQLTEFKINFYDGTWNNLALYLLSIPDSIIYAFKNDHDFGVELKSEIAGIINKEILGPDGRISFRQDFSMNPNSTDVFILRETEKLEVADSSSNKNFQIKSVVGRKFLGVKENPPTFEKVFNYLLGESGSKKVSPIEKDKALSLKVGLFNVADGKKILEKEGEIKTKVMRFTSPMKISQYENILADVEDQVVDTRSPKDESERDQRKSAAAVANNDPKNNEAYEFKHEMNVLQLGDPSKVKQKKQGGSILKNRNMNVEQEKMNLKILEEQIRSAQDLDHNDMNRLLALKKDQILQADNEDIKKLIKYFGLETFVSVYKADEFYLNEIANKLGGSLNVKSDNEASGNTSHQENISPEKNERKSVIISEENGVRKVREVIKQYVPLSDKMVQQLEKVPGIDMKSSQLHNSHNRDGDQNNQLQNKQENQQPIESPSEKNRKEAIYQEQLREQEILTSELEEQQRLQQQLEQELQKQKLIEQQYEEQRIRSEITRKKKLLKEQMELEEQVNSGEITQEELMQILALRESQGMNALSYQEPTGPEQVQAQKMQLEMLQLLEQQTMLRKELLHKLQDLTIKVRDYQENSQKNIEEQNQQPQNPQDQQQQMSQPPQSQTEVVTQEQFMMHQQQVQYETQNPPSQIGEQTSYDILVQKDREAAEKRRKEMEVFIRQSRHQVSQNKEINNEVLHQTETRKQVEYNYTLKEKEMNLNTGRSLEDKDFEHFTGVISKSSKLNEQTKKSIQQIIKDKLRFLRTGVPPPDRSKGAEKQDPRSEREIIKSQRAEREMIQQQQAYEEPNLNENRKNYEDQYQQQKHVQEQPTEIEEDVMNIHPSKMNQKQFTKALTLAPTFEEKKKLLDERRFYFPDKDIRGSIFQAKKMLVSRVHEENQHASHTNVIDNISNFKHPYEVEEGINQIPNLDSEKNQEDYNNVLLESSGKKRNQEFDQSQRKYYESDHYQEATAKQEQSHFPHNMKRSYNVRQSVKNKNKSIVSDENRNFLPVVDDINEKGPLRIEDNRKIYSQSHYTNIDLNKRKKNKKSRMSLSNVIKEIPENNLTPNLMKDSKIRGSDHNQVREEYYQEVMTEDGIKLIPKTKEETEKERERMKRLQKKIQAKQYAQNMDNNFDNKAFSKTSRNSQQMNKSFYSSHSKHSIPKVTDNFLTNQDTNVLRQSRYVKELQSSNEKKKHRNSFKLNEDGMIKSRVLERSKYSNVNQGQDQRFLSPKSPRNMINSQGRFENKKVRNTTQPVYFNQGVTPPPLQKIGGYAENLGRQQLTKSSVRQRSADFMTSNNKGNMGMSYITNEKNPTTATFDLTNSNLRNFSAPKVRKSDFVQVSNFMATQNNKGGQSYRNYGNQNQMKFSSPLYNRNNNESALRKSNEQMRPVNAGNMFSDALKGRNNNNNFISPGRKLFNSQFDQTRMNRTNNQNMNTKQLVSPQKQMFISPNRNVNQFQVPTNSKRSMSTNIKNNNLRKNQGQKRFKSPNSRLMGQRQNNLKGILSPGRQNQRVPNYYSQGMSYTNQGQSSQRNPRNTGRRKSKRESYGNQFENKYREKKSFVSGMIG